MPRRDIEAVGLVVRDLLLKHLPEYFGPDLDCACAISSNALQRAFTAMDIEATFVMGEMRRAPNGHSYGEHCWVIVEDYIIDLTARQFSRRFPEVFIVGRRDRRYVPAKTGRPALLEVNDEWIDHSPRTHRNVVNRVLGDFVKLFV
jgi:hypothetical protein